MLDITILVGSTYICVLFLCKNTPHMIHFTGRILYIFTREHLWSISGLGLWSNGGSGLWSRVWDHDPWSSEAMVIPIKDNVPLCSEWRSPGWSWWRRWPPPQSRSSQKIRRPLGSRNSVVWTASMTWGTVTLWTVSIGVTLCRLGSQMCPMTVAWGKKGSWMAFVAVT